MALSTPQKAPNEKACFHEIVNLTKKNQVKVKLLDEHMIKDYKVYIIFYLADRPEVPY